MINNNSPVTFNLWKLSFRIPRSFLLVTFLVSPIAGCEKEVTNTSTPAGFFGHQEGPTNANTPEEVFKAIIADPIPESITSIECVGDSWQGYALYLRFRASKSDIESIIRSGFEPVSWQEIFIEFDMRFDKASFKPTWNPKPSDSTKCYEMKKVTNVWTHDGMHYLFIDFENGLVYFVGKGA